MLGWIVWFALETGMRSSEIRGLRRKQIDLKRRVVRLAHAPTTAPHVPHRSRARLHACSTKRSTTRSADLVFFGEPGRGGKRQPYRFNSMWLATKRQCGLTDLHFRDLRHEAISRLVEAGLSDQEVAAISGHKSMRMLKRYTHLRSEDFIGRLGAIKNTGRA